MFGLCVHSDAYNYITVLIATDLVVIRVIYITTVATDH